MFPHQTAIACKLLLYNYLVNLMHPPTDYKQIFKPLKFRLLQGLFYFVSEWVSEICTNFLYFPLFPLTFSRYYFS